MSATATGTRRRKLRTALGAHGEPMLWLTGGALAVCLLMVGGLLALVLVMGVVTFWPAPLEQVRTVDGRVLLGEVTRDERYRPDPDLLAAMDKPVRERAQAMIAAGDGSVRRRLLRTGNFDLTNEHFTWVSDFQIEGGPGAAEWALVIERVEWGRFYGYPRAFLVDGAPVAEDPQEIWARYGEYHGDVRRAFRQRRHLEKHDLGRTFKARELARLKIHEAELEPDLPPGWARLARDCFAAQKAIERGGGEDSALAQARRQLERLEASAGRPRPESAAAFHKALEEYERVVAATEEQNVQIMREIRRLSADNARLAMALVTADGQEKIVPLEQIVRAYPANRLSLGDKLALYLARWREFLSDEPREANTEGGVFPAIVGTVLMTLIMAMLVVPFGVLAALFLREYARAGPLVSAVRIAINNLAGVPSIVFGVFGLGFFCYGVGGFIDGGPAWEVPRPTWFAGLGAAAIVAGGAFLCMLASLGKRGQAPRTRRRIAHALAGALWLTGALGGLALVATAPFFEGFFRAQLPNPTFGKGALVWASFTLALLTLPVVIVATEEALAAVPNSMREGSYACGASKWQTLKRIVLPRAMPGIMTGTILAMARGAGEVAPLMLVGAVKLAPELPVSLHASEHFGIDRSFMHLGFHIYDLGFQSQNSEAAKPFVFTTTLLLILIVALLNLTAVQLRGRLRRKFVGAQF